ncbi:MAG: 50S ribosomal protein L7/L12 [Parcubacteria group bacterium GW2011_GWA2_47_26]|nr:MAG: 50S ribosomal protein L7/L12 [Parcubacteria group bacterium GW2011_GWA2_47_26]
MAESRQTPERIEELKNILIRTKEQIETLLVSIERQDVESIDVLLDAIKEDLAHLIQNQPRAVPEGSRVIEGVFDGQYMIGADGKQYLVPPNYASKTKLVEGDMMKLSITPTGAFIYKQISPIVKKRVTGTLGQDENGFWHVNDGVYSWRVLNAAVSYFKGKAGDEAIALIPASTPSKWAAVENIISK